MSDHKMNPVAMAPLKVRPDYGLGWKKEGKCAETIGAGAEPVAVWSLVTAQM